MIRALAIMGILGAGQAMALTPLPECVPEGAERAAGIGEYSTRWHGNGFVLYPSWAADTGEYRLILDDCKGERRLVMTSVKLDDPNANADAERKLDEAVQAALVSKQRYSMGQVQAIARDAGAKTKLGKATYVSCGCDRYGDED
ncbi:MAG: hypothetical protein MUE52_20915 [Tabrizicola sp.]|jgi:hypothetical protein|nr:hypothetical protein [Tabrizicola sp.]